MAMISMLIGLLIAFFVYNDARKRGSGLIRAILWSVGSVVVPYVVLPLYLLVGRTTKEKNQYYDKPRDQYYDNDVIDIEATVVEETINCTKCGSKVKEDSLVCPYCQQQTDISQKDN